MVGVSTCLYSVLYVVCIPDGRTILFCLWGKHKNILRCVQFSPQTEGTHAHMWATHSLEKLQRVHFILVLCRIFFSINVFSGESVLLPLTLKYSSLFVSPFFLSFLASYFPTSLHSYFPSLSLPDISCFWPISHWIYLEWKMSLLHCISIDTVYVFPFVWTHCRLEVEAGPQFYTVIFLH